MKTWNKHLNDLIIRKTKSKYNVKTKGSINFQFPETAEIVNLGELSNEEYNKFVWLSNYSRNYSGLELHSQPLKSTTKNSQENINKEQADENKNAWCEGEEKSMQIRSSSNLKKNEPCDESPSISILNTDLEAEKQKVKFKFSHKNLRSITKSLEK